MKNERPFRQEAYKRELVVCDGISDAFERWGSCLAPRIVKTCGPILTLSYQQSGLGNREVLALAFSSSGMCSRFVDALARFAIEGR